MLTRKQTRTMGKQTQFKQALLIPALIIAFIILLPFNALAVSPEQAWIPGVSNIDFINNTGDLTVSSISTGSNNLKSFTYDSLKYDRSHIAVNRTGDRAYLSGSLFNEEGSNTIDVINPHTNEHIATIEISDEGVADTTSAVALNEEETRLYVGNGNQPALYVIDTTTNTVINSINTDGGDPEIPEMSRPKFLNIAPDGTLWVLNENSGNGVLFQLDAETLDLLAGPFEMPTSADLDAEYIYEVPNWIEVSVDSSKLYISCLARLNEPDEPSVESLCIYDIDANEFTHIETGAELEGEPFLQIGDLTLSPDGEQIYRPNHFDNTLSIINTIDDSLVETIEVGDTPAGVDISSDGSKLFVANSQFMAMINSGEFDLLGSVSVVDTSDNQVTDTVSLSTLLPVAQGNFIGGSGASTSEVDPGGGNSSVSAQGGRLAETGDSEILVTIAGLVILLGGTFSLKRFLNRKFQANY